MDNEPNELTRLRRMESAVEQLFALPNWQHRISEWADIHTAVLKIYEAKTGKKAP